MRQLNWGSTAVGTEHNESSSTDRCTRRQALRAGGALLTAGLAGSSAGCLGMQAPISRSFRHRTVPVPPPTSADPLYRKWMPAESELPDAQNPHSAPVRYATPGNLGNEAVGLEFTLALAIIQSSLSYFGVEFSDYDHLVGLGTIGAVVESNVDTARVESTLLDSGFQRAGSYRGYRLFDRTDIPRVVAVSDSAIVQSDEGKRRAKLEAIIDAGEGRIDRFHETDESFARFTEYVGAYPTVMTGFHLFGDEISPEETALAYTFDDEYPYLILKQQYQPGETPTRSELEDWVEPEQVRANGSVDIEIDGRHVDIKMPVKNGVTGLHPIDKPRVPFQTWGIDQDAATVTVRHEAGDPVPVEQLEIQPRDALQHPPAEGMLGPGETLTFRKEAVESASSGYIDLVYHLANGTVAPLFTYELGEYERTT